MMNFDPLLGGRSYDAPSYEREEQMRQQYVQQFQHYTKPLCPIWDEIDGIVDKMSDAEKEFLASDETYRESTKAVQVILEREILRMMRPTIEATQDGKAALEAHLALVKKAQKRAKEESTKQQALLNEYMLHYSDMSWNEFVEMKRGTNKQKKR